MAPHFFTHVILPNLGHTEEKPLILELKQTNKQKLVLYFVLLFYCCVISNKHLLAYTYTDALSHSFHELGIQG